MFCIDVYCLCCKKTSSDTGTAGAGCWRSNRQIYRHRPSSANPNGTGYGEFPSYYGGNGGYGGYNNGMYGGYGMTTGIFGEERTIG